MQCLVVTPSLPSYFFFMNKRRCTEYTDFFAMQTPIPPRSHCRFVFLHGAPGTGKTSLALDFAKHVAQGDGLAHYLKPHSKGWDGYRGQKVVIMDEAEPRCWKDLESLVKVWGDRYPFIAEVKGSSKPICPEWFVVTSNYTLPQLTDAVNRPSFFSAMKRRAEDGRRVISMETLGEYRPKRMGPQLKEYEEVFELFVKLVQGEYSVCCIMFFESQPCCCRCTMNGAEAHTLRTHATRSVAVILRALPAQCDILGDNRARPCIAMHCRRLRSPTSGFPLRITPLSHSHLLTRNSRRQRNAHFSSKSNPGALIVKVRRISYARIISESPLYTLRILRVTPSHSSYTRVALVSAVLRQSCPVALRSSFSPAERSSFLLRCIFFTFPIPYCAFMVPHQFRKWLI